MRSVVRPGRKFSCCRRRWAGSRKSPITFPCSTTTSTSSSTPSRRLERSDNPMDTGMIQFLAAPFVASLILTGIHSYLGVHVVERGVIFVDLSLAQIAALGATIGLLLPITGGDPHSPVTYWISLAFTFLGAFIF